MIPKQLQKNEFRFIKIADNKSAIEKSWGKVNNYLYSDSKFIEHIAREKRYGIVCGYGNLVVVDFDVEETQEELINKFPDTFTVKTAGKGLYHLYYIADRPDGFRINGLDGKRIADVQGKGTYVVAPNSTLGKGRQYEIVKDCQIEKISIDTIKKIFSPYLELEKIVEKSRKKSNDPEVREIMEKIKIPDLLRQWGISLTKNPTECPFHDSVNKKCFSYTDTLWHCFHCENGGNVISLIMERDNLSYFHAKRQLAEKLGIRINNVDLFIPSREEICENFYSSYPFFYDDIGLFWFWNSEEKCYEMGDEYDLLNEIKKVAAQKNFSMVGGTFWSEIIRALKLIGRQHIPKEWERTWIQFNGTVYDITTGKTFEPSVEVFNTCPIPHNIGSDDKTPIIDSLMQEWVEEEHVIELKEICFYCMIQDYPIHRIFFLFGQGLNGKGAFLRFLIKLIGLRNVTSSSIKRIVGRPFEPAKLYKKLICQMGETNFQILEDTETLKQLSGQDLISAEFKGKDCFDFSNTAKIIIATNCLPPTLDTTQGWYRRIKIIDFPNQFPEGTDPLLRIPDYEYDNFCKQLITIGSNLLIRGVFSNDGDIEHRHKEYDLRANPMRQFISLNYDLDGSEKIPFFEFAEKYQNFLKERKYRIMSKKEIGLLLGKDGYETRRENVMKNDKMTTWHFIYGLKNKLENNTDNTDNHVFTLDSHMRDCDIENVIIGNMGIINRYNLYDSIRKLDNGNGADMGECQKLMGCLDKDFEEYLSFAKKSGMIFEVGGKLKILV